MKDALVCPSSVLLILPGVYVSHPQQQPIDSTTAATAATDASAGNGWQTPRADYTACVQCQAGSGVPGATQTKDVVASALDTCEDALCIIHDGFHDHFSVSMPPSGARKVADRVTEDTREKARVCLMGYADHARYLARSR